MHTRTMFSKFFIGVGRLSHRCSNSTNTSRGSLSTRRSLIGVLLVVALCCGSSPGDEKPAGATAAPKAAATAAAPKAAAATKASAPVADPKAAAPAADPVGKTLAALGAAYNARDAKAISGLFSPTGEFIDGEGNIFHGREAIAREFEALFEINPTSNIKLTSHDVREISTGLFAADCVVQLSAGAKVESTEPVQIEFSALVVRQADGSWLLASVRSEGEESLQTPHAHLARLAWLVGEWVDESSESTMHTNTRWSEDGNFLLTDFTVHIAGRKAMSGTQRIGWDASLEQFRSWVFDSEGGFATGLWTELEDRWVVKASGARPDGLTGSGTQTYQPSPNGYTFMMTDRVVGDQAMPDFVSHIVRKPPEPARTAAAKPADR